MSVAVVPEDVEFDLTHAASVEAVVEFEYPKSGHPGMFMRRTVSPYELSDGKVLAWDHDREGLRHFMIDRIDSDVTVVDAEFIHPHT